MFAIIVCDQKGAQKVCCIKIIEEKNLFLTHVHNLSNSKNSVYKSKSSDMRNIVRLKLMTSFLLPRLAYVSEIPVCGLNATK